MLYRILFTICRDFLYYNTYMSIISTTHGECCLFILYIALFGSQYNKIQYDTIQYTKKESNLCNIKYNKDTSR